MAYSVNTCSHNRGQNITLLLTVLYNGNAMTKRMCYRVINYLSVCFFVLQDHIFRFNAAFVTCIIAKWDETNLLRLLRLLRMITIQVMMTTRISSSVIDIHVDIAIASAEKPFVLLGAEKETNQSKFQDLYTYDCIHLLHHPVQKLC